MSTRPSADRPSRRNRASALECCRSAPSRAWASRKTVTASSNDTPCFAALASAFRGSHSNTYLVYTECRGMLSATDQEAAVLPPASRYSISDQLQVPSVTRFSAGIDQRLPAQAQTSVTYAY